MASFLRKVVAGPRAPHPEANLDLCYVTDNIIATSGPSSTWPSNTYRNPLPQLVRFLDSKHGANWAIWEFRAEGTGYPDSEVYGRIWHFPWPDHHPPPFKLVPGIVASMRDWLHGEGSRSQVNGKDLGDKEGGDEKDKKGKRVVVVHCKAGKGRSGSMVVSYLLSEEGWTREAALQRFTERRMRPGFGLGVSIPSQLRWLQYVERWAKGGKVYVEQAVEVLEVHVWGLRDGVKISVEGYVDQGKKIKTIHVFGQNERDDVQDGTQASQGTTGLNTNNGSDQGLKTPVDNDNSRDPSPGSRFGNVVGDAVRKQRAGGSTSNSASRETSSSRQHPTRSKLEASIKSSTTLSNLTSTATNTSAPPSSNTNVGAPASDSSKPTIKLPSDPTPNANANSTETTTPSDPNTQTPFEPSMPTTKTNTIYRPNTPIHVPTNDINLAVQRKARASYGLTMVTSVAHVWFNCFFEGNGPENLTAEKGKESDQSGVYEIGWDAMDGLKGSSKKGARAFDKVAVIWRVRLGSRPDSSPVPAETASSGRQYASESSEAAHEAKGTASVVIGEPAPGQPIRESRPAQTDSGQKAAKEPDSDVDEEGVEGIRRGVQEL